MKLCCKCNQEKPIGDFYKKSASKDGLQSCCKICTKIHNLEFHKKNKNTIRTRVSKYRNLNKGIYRDRENNWKKVNKKMVCSYTAKRRATRKSSSPSWLEEIHIQQIKWYYRVAKLFTEQTCTPHQVDHIHPLSGNGFNGLHVPWNLRVIKTLENQIKSNHPPAEEAHLFWS
jgi:hypothetical protein